MQVGLTHPLRRLSRLSRLSPQTQPVRRLVQRLPQRFGGTCIVMEHFDAVRAQTYAAWNELLGVVLIFLGFLVSIEVFRDVRLPFTRVVLRHRREEQEAPGTSLTVGELLE